MDDEPTISLCSFLGGATPRGAEEPYRVMVGWDPRPELSDDPVDHLRGYDSKLVYQRCAAKAPPFKGGDEGAPIF